MSINNLLHNIVSYLSKKYIRNVICRFNKTLVSIQHGETRKVDIMLPEYMLDERESFKIVMALKNESSFPEKLALERQKICDCKKVEVSAGISLRKKVFVCPHRSMLEIRTGSSGTNIPVSKFIFCSYLTHEKFKL